MSYTGCIAKCNRWYVNSTDFSSRWQRFIHWSDRLLNYEKSRPKVFLQDTSLSVCWHTRCWFGNCVYLDYQTHTSTVPHIILVLILISRVCLGHWLQIEKVMLSWTNSGTYSETYINPYLFMVLLCNAYTIYIHLMFVLSLLRLSRF